MAQRSSITIISFLFNLLSRARARSSHLWRDVSPPPYAVHADTPIRAATISPRFYIDTRLTDISPLPRVIPGKFLGNHEMMKFRSTLLRMEERINEINPEEEGEERPLRVISKRLLFYERKYCRSFSTYFSVLFCKKIKIRFAIFFNRWLINPCFLRFGFLSVLNSCLFSNVRRGKKAIPSSLSFFRLTALPIELSGVSTGTSFIRKSLLPLNCRFTFSPTSSTNRLFVLPW